MATGKGREPKFLLFAALVAAVAVGAIGLLIWTQGRDGGSAELDSEVAAVDNATVQSTTVTEPPSTSARSTSTSRFEGVADEVWAFDEGLPDYVTEPRVFPATTIEGDVEVAFVNSEIATIRLLADPATEEPELAYWNTGFALQASRDLAAILVERRWRTVQGELSQLEIESVTLTDDQTADVEICSLADATTYSIDDAGGDSASSLTTNHAVMRMVKGPDGQWQTSEQVELIGQFDGIGDCLDVEIVQLGEGDEVGGG